MEGKYTSHLRRGERRREEMTRRRGDTARGPRLNPNAQNVFFMRVKSIVIWSFLFVAGMRRVQAGRLSGNRRRAKEGEE